LKLKIAVASEGLAGLEDTVSKVFGRSPTFTIIDIEDGEIKGVKVKRNPSANAPHGAGPLTCARLSRLGVNSVIASTFGPTTSDMLKELKIEKYTIHAGMKVKDAVQRYLKSRRNVYS
jgi:predicted Fe-Mo cluster-binding NifX family protein